MRDAGHGGLDTHATPASVPLDPGHVVNDAHSSRAGVDLCIAQCPRESQEPRGGASSCGDHLQAGTQPEHVAAPHDGLLLILADALDDLERVRIATDNRIRSLAQVKGLDDSPESKRLGQIRDGIAALEHDATLDLQRAMRAHPLGAWVKRTIGVGEKQAARLLAALGDPANRPNPSKLWQYAGHGDPARSRQSKDNVRYAVDEDGKTVVILPFNPTAKMRTRLIAESCIKQAHSPYRAVYDRERAKWAERDTTDLHKHNHALRVVGKAMLLDLWREARDLRSGQASHDLQSPLAAADLPPAIEDATPRLPTSAASPSAPATEIATPSDLTPVPSTSRAA